MLDFGFSEILLTSAIALVVLGPERLPKVARQVGNWMGRARLMARQLTEQLEREVNAEELLREHTKTIAPPRPVLPTQVALPTTAADGAALPVSGSTPRSEPLPGEFSKAVDPDAAPAGRSPAEATARQPAPVVAVEDHRIDTLHLGDSRPTNE